MIGLQLAMERARRNEALRQAAEEEIKRLARMSPQEREAEERRAKKAAEEYQSWLKSYEGQRAQAEDREAHFLVIAAAIGFRTGVEVFFRTLSGG